MGHTPARNAGQPSRPREGKLCSATVWGDLEGSALRATRQSRKDTYCRTPLRRLPEQPSLERQRGDELWPGPGEEKGGQC